MKANRRLKKIGRFLVDRRLIEEGYTLRDIVSDHLPDTYDITTHHLQPHYRWLRCPDCEDYSRVPVHSPVCSHCSWHERRVSPNKWAA